MENPVLWAENFRTKTVSWDTVFVVTKTVSMDTVFVQKMCPHESIQKTPNNGKL